MMTTRHGCGQIFTAGGWVMEQHFRPLTIFVWWHCFPSPSRLESIKLWIPSKIMDTHKKSWWFDIQFESCNEAMFWLIPKSLTPSHWPRSPRGPRIPSTLRLGPLGADNAPARRWSRMVDHAMGAMEKRIEIRETLSFPLVKLSHNYGKSPFSMGKSTINGDFQ